MSKYILGIRHGLSVISVISLILSAIACSQASADSGSQVFRDWSYTTSPSQRVLTFSSTGDALLTRSGQADITLLTASHEMCEDTSLLLRFPSHRREVHLRTTCRELADGGAAYSFVPNSRPGFNLYGEALDLMEKGRSMEAWIVSSSEDPDARVLDKKLFSLMGATAAFKHLNKSEDPNPKPPYSSEWRTDSETLAYLSRKLDARRDEIVAQKVNPAPVKPKKLPGAPTLGAAVSRDFISRYGHKLADQIEGGPHPACQSIASSIRMVSDTNTPDYVRQRQIDSMLDKTPDLCF